MNMTWNPTIHAVKRLKERCGIEEHQAKSYVNQLMMTAQYVTTQEKDKMVYKHDKKELYIVVDNCSKSVITVYKDNENEVSTVEDKEYKLDEVFVNALLKEYTKVYKSKKKELYALKVEHIETEIELHKSRLSHLKCKEPKRKQVALGVVERLSTLEIELAKKHEKGSSYLNTLKNQLRELGIQTPIL